MFAQSKNHLVVSSPSLIFSASVGYGVGNGWWFPHFVAFSVRAIEDAARKHRSQGFSGKSSTRCHPFAGQVLCVHLTH